MANLSTVLSNVSSGGATASSEKNYIRAPDQATSLWAASGAGIGVSTETGIANLPENATKTSAIKILRSSGTDYVRYRFTIDSSDYGKKFKLAFAMKFAGALGDYTVTAFSNTSSDYTGTSAQLTLQQNSVGPLFTEFVTTLDMPGSAAPYIEIRINGVSGTAPLYISGFIVGPGIITQGAAVSEWQSYTPVLNGTTNAVTFTNQTTVGKWRRVGDSIEVEVYTTFSGAPGAGTGYFRWSLPLGLTIDLSKISYKRPNGNMWVFNAAYNASNGIFGTGAAEPFGPAGFAFIFMKIPIASDRSNPAWPAAFASGDFINVTATFPVAEWAGSGTLNLGAAAQVEYAWNSTSATTTGTYTSNKGNGPQGTPILNYAPGTTNSVTFECDFLYPIQVDDIIVLEVDSGTNGLRWTSIVDRIASFSANDGATIYYGTQLIITGANTVQVRFYSGIYAAGAWSAVTSWRWRVRKAKASAPVGFGLATQTAAGLITNQTAMASLTAADFTAQTGCVIQASDVIAGSNKWVLTNNVVTLWLWLDQFTITPGIGGFQFILPASVPAPPTTVAGTIIVYDNSPSSFVIADVRVYTNRQLSFGKSGANWTGGTDTNYIRGQISWFVV